MFETPILFIVFNRPETTQQVFNVIRRVRPKYLFIAADGPRPEKPADIDKCKKTREIFEQVDWDCIVKTLFRDSNKGCGKGPAEAITWFFKNVDEGIILEDDCLPNEGFFKFIPFMLEKYRNDNRISMIIGTNFLREWKPNKHSYFFSLFAHTWGWASWKRAWKHYDFELKDWGSIESQQILKRRLQNKKMYEHLCALFNSTKKNAHTITWWDFQWLCCMQISNGLCIVPSVNLVRNIGIGQNATHTISNTPATPILEYGSKLFPISENNCVKPDKKFDSKYFRKAFLQKRSFAYKILRYANKRIKQFLIWKSYVSVKSKN